MSKQIPTAIGILIILLFAGVVGTSVFLLSQEKEESVIIRETIERSKPDKIIADDYRKKELGENGFIEVGHNSSGAVDALFLFGDKTFFIIEMITASGPYCYTGKVSSQEYNDILKFIKDEDLVNLEITQAEDDGLLCEGVPWVRVNDFNGQSNSLHFPCVEEYTEDTERISAVWSNLFSKILAATEVDKEECEAGFIDIHDHYSDMKRKIIEKKH